MNSTLVGYLLNSAFMIITLSIFMARSYTAILEKTSRRYTQLLIGMTLAYVVIDLIFIACHLSGQMSVGAWKIVSFIFYLIYTILPFTWHLFVRNFVGSTLSDLFRKAELIPIVVLLVMIFITPFNGALYYFDEGGMYTRGSLYTFYSYLNYFYYAESFLDLIIIYVNHKESNERYAFRTMLISLVMLLGSFANGAIIPPGTIFPFMPFCSVIVTMLAFYFIASKESEMLKDKQKEAIQDALNKAKEASEAKTVFLSRVSHDIRTPMNAIINLTELAQKENDLTTIHEYLNKMMISSKFLLGLINDILDMSRIESGELTLHKETLTRSEFLNTVDTVIHPLMEEKHINFHRELNPGEYIISVDKLRFNQIFFNLLSNAAKFTPEGGDVWFEVTNLKTDNNKLKIKFVVRDNGIGMSEEFQKHLFEPFAQEHTKLSSRTQQGSGLGLPIVKSLVEAMGGTITFTSKLHEGTEFVVMLEVDIVSKEDTSIKDNTDEIEIIPSSLNVLLAEDNEMNAYIAKIILEEASCKVTTAENGKEAVDIFRDSKPNTFDVILMDIRMPIIDGLEATRTIRSLDRSDAKSVPIVAMTADAFDDDRKRTLEAGMNYHLTKPVDAGQLYAVLNKCVSKNKRG